MSGKTTVVITVKMLPVRPASTGLKTPDVLLPPMPVSKSMSTGATPSTALQRS